MIEDSFGPQPQEVVAPLQQDRVEMTINMATGGTKVGSLAFRQRDHLAVFL